MAGQSNLLLGFPFKDFKRVVSALDISPIDFDDVNKFDQDVEKFKAGLIACHRHACEELGFKHVKTDATGYLIDVIMKTPSGKLTFRPFTLELNFDPEDMQEESEDAIISIPLTSRYKPTFADWKASCGGLYPIVFDEELRNIIEIARRHIATVLPIFNESLIIIKEEFY